MDGGVEPLDREGLFVARGMCGEEDVRAVRFGRAARA